MHATPPPPSSYSSGHGHGHVPSVTVQLVEVTWGDLAFNSHLYDTPTSPTEQVHNHWATPLYEPWLSEWTSHLIGASEAVLIPPEASTASTPLYPQNWQVLLEEHPNKLLASFFMSGISHGFSHSSTKGSASNHAPDLAGHQRLAIREAAILYQRHDMGSMLPCLFFGFLRVSEFTIPSQEQYDQSCHLSLGGVSLDNRDTPRLLRIHIKQSKTDPFRRGVEIYLGATDDSICPLKGILPYLALRGRRDGPLFIFSDGKGLTRQLFSSMLANFFLRELNMDAKCYNTHSFRIGAATSAKMANIPDTYIKMLGRWRSDTYQQYIKTPPEELAKLSKHLTSGYRPLASAT